MTDGAALLAAVLAHPGEDTPRLVYADWLQENGQLERAEFIRVQVELARMPAYAHLVIDYGLADGVSEECKRAFTLRRRERELLRSEALAPHLAVPGLSLDVVPGQVCWVCHYGDLKAEFARGFAAGVEGPWEIWCDHADAILKAHPVRTVKLTTRLYRVCLHNKTDWPRVLQIGEVQVARIESGQFCVVAVASDEAVLATLDFEWPGVAFELPSVVSYEATWELWSPAT